jgi:hypothetical protein
LGPVAFQSSSRSRNGTEAVPYSIAHYRNR